MKKAFLALALICVAGSAMAGQGGVIFNNRVPGSVDAKVFDSDGTTPLSGTGFFAQLYVSAPGANNFQKVGAVTTFRTGTAAGYWNGIDVTFSLASMADGGTADLQARAWTGAADWESAVGGAAKRGQSPTLANFDTANPNASPAETNPPMVGLQSFNISGVPEPATLTLGALAAASLLFRRRRQNQAA